MFKRVVLAVAGFTITTAAQTLVDPTQLKRPVKTGTVLPAGCTAGDLFFKTDAQPGANLYGCAPANTWSVVGGFPTQNCWYNSTAQLLQCQDSNGNVFTPVKGATGPTANQWVDYVSTAGVPHTSQPTAAQVQNAVDQTANYSNPSWIGSLAWSKLSGVPASFNAGQLQGRNVTGAAPADLQYLGWNNAAAQWEPKTLPTGPVSSVFGRAGAVAAQAGDYTTAQVTESGNLYFTNARVWASLSAAAPLTFNSSTGQIACPGCLTSNVVTTVFGRSGAVMAQTGDYSFAQLSGSASPSQLPVVAMRTDQSNAVTAGTQDFSSAAHTLTMKSGLVANLPNACSAGETYFATDAPAGSNIYGCASANTWTTEGTGAFTIATDGTPIGTSAEMNFVTGLGLTNTIVNTGSQINVQIGLDSAIVQTQSTDQSGADLYCASASNSAINYQCSLNPTGTAYITGMMLHWVPDITGAGGATTINIDQLGTVPLLLADGVTNPRPGDIVAGELYNLWYDGSHFRMTGAASGTGVGSVNTVFGRTGAVTAQKGDYAASQITGLSAVATSGSFTDLINTPSFQTALTTGTQDQLLNGTLALTSLSNCATSGGVLWYAATTHQFTCHTLASTDLPPLNYQPIITGAPSVWPTFSYQTVQANAVAQAQRANLNFSSNFSLADSSSTNRTTVDLAGTINSNTSGNAATATALAATPAQCSSGYATGVAASGAANCTVLRRGIGYVFDGGGSALTPGPTITKYLTVPFACSITAWNMTVDTGTATVDVWKAATGGAIPISANTITASATPAISSGTALHSTTLTGWTTAVAANDIFGFNLKAASAATTVSLVLECDQ